MVNASQFERRLAALVLLVANGGGIGQVGLVISGATASGFQARRWRSCGNATACRQVCLRWSSAREASRLAPAEQARSLAVFEAIVSSCGVAITASIADANLCGHATLELAMINATESQSLLSTLVALVAESVVIERSDGGLIIR